MKYFLINFDSIDSSKELLDGIKYYLLNKNDFVFVLFGKKCVSLDKEFSNLIKSNKIKLFLNKEETLNKLNLSNYFLLDNNFCNEGLNFKILENNKQETSFLVGIDYGKLNEINIDEILSKFHITKNQYVYLGTKREEELFSNDNFLFLNSLFSSNKRLYFINIIGFEYLQEILNIRSISKKAKEKSVSEYFLKMALQFQKKENITLNDFFLDIDFYLADKNLILKTSNLDLIKYLILFNKLNDVIV